MRVLIFYDVPGWAWWYKARAIQQHLGSGIAVDLLQFGNPFDLAAYDYVLLFGYYMLAAFKGDSFRKVILGSTSNHPEYLKETIRRYQEGGCRALFANSAIGAKALAPCGRVFLCQNGVDTGVFHPARKAPDELTAVWVGNPNSDIIKGLDLIQEACALTRVPLHFCAREAKTGLEADIFTHRELCSRFYQKAKVYICASSANEATPNSALEALACGLPLITTPVGNMPEIVKDGVNGFFVERSVPGIIEGINRMKAAAWPAMSRAARLSVENGWSWPSKVKNFERMLLTLAKEDGIV